MDQDLPDFAWAIFVPASQFTKSIANTLIMLRTLISLLLPTVCVLCRQHSSSGICDGCQRDYLRNTTLRCQQCALPLFTFQDTICGTCLKEPPHFNKSLVCSNYNSPIDSIVLGLKFAGKLNNADIIAQHLAKAIHRQSHILTSMPDLLCPVPLSKKRLRSRGFNQAWEIARLLGQELKISTNANLLWRTKETLQQSSLHPDERHQNIQGAFAINPKLQHLINGQHVAVVDDVMTTGTTLNEIAKILKRYGAAQVSNFVFARTDRH